MQLGLSQMIDPRLLPLVDSTRAFYEKRGVGRGPSNWSELQLVRAAESLKSALEQVGAAHGPKLGKTQVPVRVAVTGRTVGLPLFEFLGLLGRERTPARLSTALERHNV
ncbi:glutamyl/glutaminyl-tRNA synthetase [Nocardiopsis algeriensis]|uniref:Glutamyl/glutaminyl-tRNA synthetase n=1 Tax=Nocardiopsis algeriensis TaxID=1478215 RepID=A0A841J1R3_9ACTN|nr:glutamyl/glutaminyl-tRNA synthetase [Nocardiopsis algeriensis]